MRPFDAATTRRPAPLTVTAPNLPTLCALLRGESPDWPSFVDNTSIEAFLSGARYHGVTPLLDARFGAMPASGLPQVKGGSTPAGDAGTTSPPEAIRRACHEDALVQSMHELQQRTELVRVLAALTAAGMAPLILKGTALAYSHYASSMLRPRADCDLLVAPAFRDAGARVQLGLA